MAPLSPLPLWPAPPRLRATARAPASASTSRPRRAWDRGARPPGGKNGSQSEKQRGGK